MGQQRAPHFDAEIEPWRSEAHRFEVVDDIHAADEGDARIDHRQLAMQAPQAVRIGTPAPAHQRTIEQHADACRFERIQPCGRQLARAHAVDQQPHPHATPGGAHQRITHRLGGWVGVEDIGFEMDFGVRGVDRRDQRREEFGTALQQAQPVAGNRLGAAKE